jgi:4-hydroxybenzoate polyprenyltransferase
MLALCFIGCFILLILPLTAILLGFLSLGLVAIYPFMKRYTYWPQIFLGLAFNWGALMGWAAATGSLAPPAAALYIGGIFWTLFYDTIYAHQDKDDDVMIGVKSTALKLGENTRPALAFFALIALALFTLAGWMVALDTVFYFGMGLALLHVAWQLITLDINDPANCLKRFNSNHIFGAVVFAAIVAGSVL